MFYVSGIKLSKEIYEGLGIPFINEIYHGNLKNVIPNEFWNTLQICVTDTDDNVTEVVAYQDLLKLYNLNIIGVNYFTYKDNKDLTPFGFPKQKVGILDVFCLGDKFFIKNDKCYIIDICKEIRGALTIYDKNKIPHIRNISAGSFYGIFQLHYSTTLLKALTSSSIDKFLGDKIGYKVDSVKLADIWG